MRTTQTVPQGKHTASQGELYMSVELADKTWKLTPQRRPARAEPIHRGRRRHRRSAGVPDQGPHALQPEHPVQGPLLLRGRPGRLVAAPLAVEQGIDNIVVDAASIEVNRRARRAKTDRLDGDKLLAMLLRHHAGERVWSVLHEPSAEAEDERRTHRELARLIHERIAHTNRIGSLLVLHNLRAHIVIGGRDWAAWWERHSAQVPPLLRAEIERESARLKLVKEQIKALEATRRQEIEDGKQPLVAQLIQLRAIGPKGAWVLVKEVFGWREFANRRELAGCVGLAPTPYASGDSEIEQGISKAGNRRVRAMLVEQAWKWLQLQPDSALTQWFNRRFASAGKRMRRVGIVAVARRLVIALWRYLKHGEIPAGAVLKPVTG